MNSGRTDTVLIPVIEGEVATGTPGWSARWSGEEAVVDPTSRVWHRLTHSPFAADLARAWDAALTFWGATAAAVLAAVGLLVALGAVVAGTRVGGEWLLHVSTLGVGR